MNLVEEVAEAVAAVQDFAESCELVISADVMKKLVLLAHYSSQKPPPMLVTLASEVRDQLTDGNVSTAELAAKMRLVVDLLEMYVGGETHVD